VSYVGPAFGRSVQVRHLTGVPAIEPIAKELQLGEIGRWRDTAEIEPELARLGLDRW
jgi:hypothetical protein